MTDANQDSPLLPGTEARFERFEVGRFECTALSDGGIVIHPPPAAVVRTESSGAQGGPVSPPVIVVPINCLAVKVPESGKLVLFDSGFGLSPDTLGKPMPSAGRLLASMEMAGLHPDAVDVLLISHLDIDHVAGLYDASGNQIFRNAQYYASGEALTYWSKKDVDLSASPVPPWVKKERLHVAAHVLQHARERLIIFHPGEEVLPGIQVVDLPGHAPGQVGFALTSEGETLFYTADAITHPLISLETPDTHNIMDLDPVVAVATRKKLLAALAGSGWRSFSPHFPFPAWGSVSRQDESHIWNACK